jgi:hypothetical protein
MSTIRPITIDDTEGILVGPAATAVLAPASRYDLYQIGDDWFGVGNFDSWEYGREVQGMNLWQRFPFLVGDILEIHDLEGKLPQYAAIRAIKMIEAANITDDDIRLLGFRDRNHWLEGTAGGMGGRRGWLLSVDRLEDYRPSTTVGKRIPEVSILSEAGEERIFLEGRDKES